MNGAYRIPDSLSADIDDLERRIADFRAGQTDAAQLKAYRVPMGIYEQRVRGAYMVRVRCAAGVIAPAQLRAVANAATLFGSGRLHVTTRQEVQIHDVALESLVPALRDLHAAGLSSRGGGGNTVRNITVSWDAGIAPQEAFDVTPYALELTSRLVADSSSWNLPRKFKIAFSGDTRDTAYATFNDVGFIARIVDGRRGFRVFAAGGMGRMPHPGRLLHEFVQANEVFEIAEAIKRVFSAHGNRRNRHSARLRFLWNTLGETEFRRLYEQARSEVRAQSEPFTVEPDCTNAPQLSGGSDTVGRGDEYARWLANHTGAQKQSGYHWVRVPLTLGDMTSAAAQQLADRLERTTDVQMRFTQDQNIVLRYVAQRYLADAYELSANLTSQRDLAPALATAVACAGATTCQLGICRSRDALSAVIAHVREREIDFDALGPLRLHLSGCSNSCGQHALADLGFYGKVARADSRTYPAYTVVAGACLDGAGGSAFAAAVGEIAARYMPQFVEQALRAFIEYKVNGSNWRAYLDNGGTYRLAQLCEQYRTPSSFESDPSSYRDWGSDTEFTLEGRGGGECAAGLFDLVDIELAKMRQERAALATVASSERSHTAYCLIVHAVSALLPTRGIEVSDGQAALKAFIASFIDNGLIDSRLRELVETALTTGSVPDHLLGDADALATSIETLYSSLDDSLQIHAPTQTVSPSSRAPDIVKDLRGVACPMNFVKTKLELAKLGAGGLLEVLLDDGAPIENVPRSVEAEGHRVVVQEKRDGYWALRVERGGRSA